MDACTGVEKEVDKVLSKFGGINDHADRTLGDLCTHIESLKNSIEEGTWKNLNWFWINFRRFTCSKGFIFLNAPRSPLFLRRNLSRP
jgi:hypothetical protein